MRRILMCVVCLLWAISSFAQFTAVSATVTDSNGTPYVGGTFNARLNTALGTTPTLTSGLPITLSGQPTVLYDPVNGISGSLDASGSFTVNLIANASILPASTQWVFTICSQPGSTIGTGGTATTGQTCFKSSQTISGTSQSLTSSLSAAAPVWYYLNVPSVKATGANLAFMVEGTGNSLSTSGIGQNAASQFWFYAARPIQPATSVSNTGGSLLTGHTFYIQVSYNSAAGESLPSSEVAINLSSGGCASSACSVTVTAPTLPSGYTSYTVYSSDSGGSGSGGEKRQDASNACVAITGNCIIQSAGAGAAPPTTNASYLQPSPIAPENSPNSGGSSFFKDTVGTWHPAFGVDTTAGLSFPAWASGGVGTLALLSPLRYNDTTHTQQGNNAVISINHQAGTYTNTANQDRAVWIQNYISDSNTHWGIEGLQIETGVTAGFSPTINGSPDGEMTAGSFQMSNSATNTQSASLGLNGVRAQAYREIGAGATSASASSGYHGIYAIFQNNSSVAGASGFGAAVTAKIIDTTAANDMQAYDFYAQAPGASRFATINRGVQIENFGDWAVHSNDFNFFSAGSNGNPTQGVNFFGGNVFLPNILTNGSGTIGITGSINPIGAVVTSQFGSFNSPITSISNIGSAGATVYTYQAVALDAAGGQRAAATTINTATGNATLNGTNFNRLLLGATGLFRGTTCYNIYRTASGGTPSSTGKIGQVCPVSTANTTSMSQLTFDDTGLAGDGSTVPAANTSGQIQAAGIIQGANTVRVASDVVLNADTALHTITGLTWNLDSSAKNYSFHCWLQYSQATAGAANNIGIQSATVAATNIAANGQAQTNTTAFTAGPGVVTLASTTATNVIGFTPGATATVFNITMDGTIEQPAFGGGNVINIMASTGAAADALTIKRGSYCTLNP